MDFCCIVCLYWLSFIASKDSIVRRDGQEANTKFNLMVSYGVSCCLMESHVLSLVDPSPLLFNPLTTDDDFWRHQILAACYQLAQSILKIGSALAERVGQGEVGGCTALADSAWRRLQLPVEKLWSMLGGPFVCFLAQTGVEKAPFTL